MITGGLPGPGRHRAAYPSKTCRKIPAAKTSGPEDLKTWSLKPGQLCGGGARLGGRGRRAGGATGCRVTMTGFGL